jgi:Protein of unknown function (DUF3829)
MLVPRSWLPVGILALSSVAFVGGCRKDEPPAPTAETAKGPNPANKAKVNLRNNPLGNMRIDPQAMKDYRIDVCHYGTYALNQARDAYFASLGKEEPSEKKIPNFGLPNQGAPTPPGATSAGAPPDGSAKAKAPPPKAAAAGSGAASVVPPSALAPHAPDRRFDFARAPYERNARACSAAAALKEPAMGDVDGALKEFAPLAVELAKDIVAANTYYAKEEYKKDSFEKGKALHKKLVEEFGKLDELHDKVGKALDAWRKEHPADLSKAEEGQKLGNSVIEDGKALILAIVPKKPDMEAYKAASAKLNTDFEALKTHAQGAPTDAWGKIMVTPLDVFVRTAKEGEGKVESHDPETYLSLVNGFVGVVEARQRALSRSMQKAGSVPGMPPMQMPAVPVPQHTAAQPE